MISKLPSAVICLLAGALMTLAYAPYDIFFVAIICPAILLIIWSNNSPAKAFCHGYLFGLGMFSTGVYWLYISINLFGGMNFLGAIFFTFLFIAFMSLYPAIFGYISRRWFAQNNTVYLILACPTLWVLTEWTRSWLFTGFPWLNLGYSQIDSVLSGIAPIFGVYGITWLCILIAGLLAYLYSSKGKHSLTIIFSIIILSITSWSLTQINWAKNLEKNISVALVQAAIPQKLKWRPELRQQSLELYMQLSEPYWGNDLLIWPETAIPAYHFTVPDFIEKLSKLSNKRGTTFLSGIPSKKKEAKEYFNSVMMLSNGDTSWYHKQHLVPFGEYLPLKPIFGVVLNFLQIPMSDFSAGIIEAPLLITKDLTLGISICYEDTFGEEVIKALPEASVLVNVSNDAWFGDSLAPHQHLQMARMRALESGRYMLRATNTGISAIINEKGKVVNQSAQFEATTLSAEIRTFEGSTPYAMWGNYPVVITAFLIVFLIIFQTRKKQILS
jgi:apolipoprotein N-acyltransferase